MDISNMNLCELNQLKIELMSQYNEVVKRIMILDPCHNPTKKPGRPKGSKSNNSLDSCILRALQNFENGLTFSGILQNVYEQGYKTTSSDEVFRNMLKSRLSCLKTDGLINKDEKTLVFNLVNKT